MQSLWLYLHFPHLQLDSLCHGNKVVAEDSQGSTEVSSDSHPVVILHGQSNSVIQLNAYAYDAGIRIGMGLGTAAALAQDLQVLPYNPEIEGNKLKEIAEHLYLVTSDISLFPPDGLLLRIHNMLSLYGGLSGYWKVLRSQLKHFDVAFRYASGQSPYAARLLAHTGWDQLSDHRPMLVHQIGLRSLQDSELDHKTVTKLNRVGIHTIADLLSLSLKDIAKRFDIDLVTYLGRLTGEFHHPIHFYHPQSRFSRYLELLYEISHCDTLLHPMKNLLGALEQFLKVRDQLTHKIHFILYQRDADKLELEVGSAQAEYHASKWAELTALKLEQLKLDAPVYALNLISGPTHIRSPEKADLFSASKGTLSCLQLISLLQAKLGDEAVQQIALQDDYRPEQVNLYRPVNQNSLADKIQFLAMRPSFLLAAPAPLSEKITVIHGPERISTGWWDDKPITRDYFIAQNTHGQWLWVYRTPSSNWFVHGLFS